MNYRLVSRRTIKLGIYYYCCCYCVVGTLALAPLRPIRVGGSLRRHSHSQRKSHDDEQNESRSSSMKNVNVDALLNSMLERADRTLSCVEGFRPEKHGTVNNNTILEAQVTVRDLLQGVQDEILLHDKSDSESISATTTASVSSEEDDDNHEDDVDDLLNYSDNPTITMTALAHTLWKSILRPGRDSAIDATAGNGGDAKIIAELLFAPSRSDTNINKNMSHLVCIDIQRQACQATQTNLSKLLTEDVLHDHVSIHHGSHAPLTLPPSGTGPVALVAYNLGYLPGQEHSFDSTTTITETSTTLTSLSDAVLCLRMGGLLSVLTYPQTNVVEDMAVQAFVEGLALFSSRTHDWRDFLVEPDSVHYAGLGKEDEIRREIRQRLQYIHEELGARQCWRVHVHEKLGWHNAPRLLTATRVR